MGHKSSEDLKLLERFNEVAALMQALESLPNGNREDYLFPFSTPSKMARATDSD